MTDHDDIADGRLEEAMHREQRAQAALNEMEALLDAPDRDGRLDEEEAVKLAGEFVGCVKGINDDVTVAERHREMATEEGDG